MKLINIITSFFIYIAKAIGIKHGKLKVKGEFFMAISLPSSVRIVVDNNTATIRFTKGAGATRTEIDRFWVNGQGTFDAYTSYSAFYYDNLEWGKTYQFQLRSWNTAGEIALDPTIYEFTTVQAIVPTPPTNINIVTDKNTASITFNKGAGIRTQIDKFWVNGEGTYDEYTTGTGFHFTSLTYGETYRFKLRSLSNDGSVADNPTVYEFKIEDEIIPIAPNNVNVVVFRNNAEIRFTKGNGVRTDIDKYWVNGQGSWDESTYSGEVFYANNLEWGSHNVFKLRTVGNTGLTAETVEISFDIQPEIVPIAPSNVAVEVVGNTATLRFTKGAGIRTEIDKFWVNGQETWDEYTTDSAFFYDNLSWGTTYQFKLRSVGNTGLTATDDVVYSFQIEPGIVPTPPTNVNVEVFKNSISITFEKGTGLRTEIAKSWEKGLEVWDEYTSGTGFWYQNLPWGTQGKFKLRTTSNTGAVAETSIISFSIEKAIVPTPCVAIDTYVLKNRAEISFIRGEGERIQLVEILGGNESVMTYTYGEKFFLDNLTWGKAYRLKLRSLSNDGTYADSVEFTMTIEDAIIPTPCVAIDTVVTKNVAEIYFVRGEGERIQLIETVDGVETVYAYTLGEAMYLENLEWGKTYNFKLRSLSNTGAYVDSNPFVITVEDAIIPTPCVAIMPNVYRNTCELFFVRGEGERIQLIETIDGVDTVYSYTFGEAFFLENLTWGKCYEFKLRSLSNTGAYVDSVTFYVEVEQAIVPTAPTNVITVVDKNTLSITFNKGAGLRTQICKSWVNGIDVWDEYTTGGGFYYNDMPWGTACSFKLRSLSNDGSVAETQLYTVNIENAIIPTVPTNVIITIDEAHKNYVTINFTNGAGVRTEIDKFWVDGEGTWDGYTAGQGFILENLPWGGHYEFKLRSKSNTGAVAETEVYSFDIVPNPAPTVPTNVTQEVFGNTVTVRFDKGVGVKTEIDCSWINGLGTYDMYTGGNAFYIEGLPYDSQLQYKLKTVSVGGQTIESNLYTFYTGIQ